jgi:predicted nucleic acid-binding protein
MKAIRSFAEDILPVVAIHWVQQSEHEAAVAAVLAASRRNLSLVDCTSFLTMRAAGSRTALTLVGHFGEQGFEMTPTPS